MSKIAGSSFKALPGADHQNETRPNRRHIPLQTLYPATTDDELRSAADALFLELDRREPQP